MNRILLVAVIAGSPAIVRAQATRDSTARTMTARVDAYLAPLLRGKEFSGSILIRRGGATLVERSYGMANREFAVPNGPDTRFLVGSISKEFTAAAILVLEQQGKLSTADHLDKFIPGFPNGGAITLAQMLTHTSGISRDLSNRADAAVPHTGAELAAIIAREPAAFPPGAKYGYSNNAYKLLAYVVELVAGEPYGAFLERELLRPLGMNDTGDYASMTLVPRLASGYTPGFGPDGFGPAPQLDISNSRGAASIYSTPRDLAEWSERFFLRGERYPGVRDRMVAGTGIGVGVATRNGHRVYSHDGVYLGYTAYLATYPDDNRTVVYLGNTETAASVSPLEVALDAIASGGTVAPAVVVARGAAVPRQKLDDYPGVYEFFPGFQATIRRQGNDLMLGVGEGDYPLEWRGNDEMFFRLKDADVTFARGADGKVASLEWVEAGNKYPAKRVR